MTNGSEDGSREAHQLCYVKGRWAYFASVPVGEVWGDDWNDAPYDLNAGNPYDAIHRDGVRVPIEIIRVAFDGDLETPNRGYSVEQINAKATPWLTSWRDSKNTGRIWAGTTLAEFRTLVDEAGGDVYERAPDGSRRDAYVQGARDMRDRAVGVCHAHVGLCAAALAFEKAEAIDSVASEIEALDLNRAPRAVSPVAWVPRALRDAR